MVVVPCIGTFLLQAVKAQGWPNGLPFSCRERYSNRAKNERSRARSGRLERQFVSSHHKTRSHLQSDTTICLILLTIHFLATAIEYNASVEEEHTYADPSHHASL
jgi:hypothetical protein